MKSAPNANQWSRLGSSDAYASIQYGCAGFVHHKGIAIEFRDLWQIFNHRTHAQQSFFQSCNISSNTAAKPGESQIDM